MFCLTIKFTGEPIHNFLKCDHREDLEKILGEETFFIVNCQDCRTTFHQNILTPELLNILYSQWISDNSRPNEMHCATLFQVLEHLEN